MRTCRECGRDESEYLDFKDNANICIPCHKKYMKAYRKANRRKLSRQVQEWRDANRERHREASRRRYGTPDGKAKHQARVERHKQLLEESGRDTEK